MPIGAIVQGLAAGLSGAGAGMDFLDERYRQRDLDQARQDLESRRLDQYDEQQALRREQYIDDKNFARQQWDWETKFREKEFKSIEAQRARDEAFRRRQEKLANKHPNTEPMDALQMRALEMLRAWDPELAMAASDEELDRAFREFGGFEATVAASRGEEYTPSDTFGPQAGGYETAPSWQPPPGQLSGPVRPPIHPSVQPNVDFGSTSDDEIDRIRSQLGMNR